MKGDPGIYIRHIIESIRLIEEYTAGKTEADFRNTISLQDMVFRRLEIIGEAVKNLPESLKSAYPEIPWKSIAGMRDKLIHHYFGVDIMLAWNAVVQEMPRLKTQMLSIARSLHLDVNTRID